MGAPMAGHLLDQGYQLSVFNRTRERAAGLVEAGAEWRDSPGDVAADADAVFTMLGYPADVRDVVLGDGGVLRRMRPGSALIDMTTSEPSLAVEIHDAAAAKGDRGVGRPGVRRRRGRTQRGARDHGRRKRDGFSRVRATVRGARPESDPAWWRRYGPAHQDGQPDRHRIRHGRLVRVASVRARRRVGPRADDRHDRGRRCRLVVAVELRTPDHRAATSSPDSRSITSSRTSGSRFRRHGG